MAKINQTNQTNQIYQQIAAYLDYCENLRQMSPTTMHTKRSICQRFVAVTGIGSLTELTNAVFNRWTAHELARGITARSLNTYNSTILALVAYHRELGLPIPLQTALLRKFKEARPRRLFYTAEEIAQVLQFAPPHTRLMIKIIFETGMRIAEITHLRLLNLDGRRIEFIGKGQKPREVYLRPETARELAAYIRAHGVTDYIWGAQGGTSHLPPTVDTIRRRLREPFYAAGFRDFYPHALRHSFATNLQRHGASVAEIKEMLGHESIATTERYLHGFEGRLQELFDKYH